MRQSFILITIWEYLLVPSSTTTTTGNNNLFVLSLALITILLINIGYKYVLKRDMKVAQIDVTDARERMAMDGKVWLGVVQRSKQTDASKPVARNFNLRNHSHHNMTICGLYLHHENTESRKKLQ